MFVEEYYVADEFGKFSVKELRIDYEHWCKLNGEIVVNQRTLAKELQRLNIAHGRNSDGYFYGLRKMNHR